MVLHRPVEPAVYFVEKLGDNWLVFGLILAVGVMRPGGFRL
jgi:hypothetical protein